MRTWGKSMSKKILIGSMLVLAMLLLMPSIPAVQQKSIEEGFKQELQEKLESFNLDNLKDIKDLDRIRHPILYVLVVILLELRFEQAFRMFKFAFDCAENEQMYLALLGLLRWLWIDLTFEIFYNFWNNISDKLGWGWDWDILLDSIPDN